MRYIIVFSLFFSLFGAAHALDEGAQLTPENEQEVVDFLTGTWAEDVDVTLDEINERLLDENLDAATRVRLNNTRRIVVRSDVVLIFNADGSAEIEGVIGTNRIEERGTVEVISIDGKNVVLDMSGGDQFFDGEISIVLDKDEFHLLSDGIKRTYKRR